MITEDYVSFETAKLLKEKGFNEMCFKYALNGEIYNNGDFVISHVDDVEVGIPTLQTAMKWLREIHNLHIVIDRYYYIIDRVSHIVDGYKYSIKIKRINTEYTADFDSYEQACEATIKYCLENLI